MPIERLRFEWDSHKAAKNKRKHRVTFEEAESVFYDDNALMMHDPHESDEDRFVLMGLGFTRRVLVVCHCYRENDAVIRIISARKADANERRQYETRWR